MVRLRQPLRAAHGGRPHAQAGGGAPTCARRSGAHARGHSADPTQEAVIVKRARASCRSSAYSTSCTWMMSMYSIPNRSSDSDTLRAARICACGPRPPMGLQTWKVHSPGKAGVWHAGAARRSQAWALHFWSLGFVLLGLIRGYGGAPARHARRAEVRRLPRPILAHLGGNDHTLAREAAQAAPEQLRGCAQAGGERLARGRSGLRLAAQARWPASSALLAGNKSASPPPSEPLK